MWQNTTLTSLLDLKYPIIQAPMAGGVTTPELISEVCNFGALGSLGAGYMTPDVIDATLKITKTLSSRPFNVNLFIPNDPHLDPAKLEKMTGILKPIAEELQVTLPIPTKPFLPPFEKQVEVLFDHNISIFSFTFGSLEPSWIKRFKEKNIFLIGTATNEAEAKYLEQTGVDAICLQGKEAGGHRGSFLVDPTESLIPIYTLIESVSKSIKIPVIAAGGIMNGEDLLKALKLGASGVQMGTAFLTTIESGAKEPYKKALLEEERDTSTVTRCFTGKCARALKNDFTSKLKDFESDILDYPIQHILTKPIRVKAAQENNKNLMALWAGLRAFLCEDLSSSALLKKIVNECEASKG